jgi:hypothetical protein
MVLLVVGSLEEAEASGHGTLEAQWRLRLDLAVQDLYQSLLGEVVLSLLLLLKIKKMEDDWQQRFHNFGE